ncbi:MAG: hypothetical protein JST95_11445 [Bacteroidetes bacterium]|nr:hypothetical protein [Bacteroidota bacterium]
MEYIVVTELEIDGEKFNNFSSLTLRQAYQDHHKFEVHFKQSNDFFYNSNDIDQFVGKPVTITYNKTFAQQIESCYSFQGYILEVQFVKSDTGYPDFVLIGFSKTIKLEDGTGSLGISRSFMDKSVKSIITEVINNRVDNEIHPDDFLEDLELDYSCQFNETSFHYLRYMSMWFSGNMHYNGEKLIFGHPGTYPVIDDNDNYDLLSLRMNLKLSPQKFSSYSYDPAKDKLINSQSPASGEKFGKNSSFLQSESRNFFDTKYNSNFNDLKIFHQKVIDGMASIRQNSIAADLQSIRGTSFNPAITIGRILRVKAPGGNYDLKDQDYEPYLITRAEHFTEDGNKYYNRFEGIPYVELKTYVQNNPHSILGGSFEPQKAYPMLAHVKDNKDPQNQGRIKAQMFWQEEKMETTNWIRVMSPDAGSGKDGASNRGFVAIPEIGDQVMLDFQYAQPDFPFVMGGMFHGKSGGGGGQGNSTKSITHKSGSHITLIETRIDMCDASGNFIQIDGTNTIKIQASAKVEIKVGNAVFEVTPSKISLTAEHIEINGTTDAKMFSGSAEFKTESGGEAKMKGTKAIVQDTGSNKISADGKIVITGTGVKVDGTTGMTEIKGVNVKVN